MESRFPAKGIDRQVHLRCAHLYLLGRNLAPAVPPRAHSHRVGRMVETKRQLEAKRYHVVSNADVRMFHCPEVVSRQHRPTTGT